MRILPFMPPCEGYEPSPVELNYDEGILDISHEAECTLLEESKIIPQTLILRCSLRPIPLENRHIKVRLISEGEMLEEVVLYDEESVAFGFDLEIENTHWKGIALDYTGIGQGIYEEAPFTFYGNNLPFGKIEISEPLYTKPFTVETVNLQERTTTLPSGQVLTSPPGLLDSRMLRPYGGYYKEGIPLEDIQQVYYSLTSTRDQTRVKLTSSTTLKDEHMSPPLGGKTPNYAITFNPLPQEEHYLSLPGAIAAGYAHLFVSTEWGKMTFNSFLCEPIAGSLKEVNVYFRS